MIMGAQRQPLPSEDCRMEPITTTTITMDTNTLIQRQRQRRSSSEDGNRRRMNRTKLDEDPSTTCSTSAEIDVSTSGFEKKEGTRPTRTSERRRRNSVLAPPRGRSCSDLSSRSTSADQESAEEPTRRKPLRTRSSYKKTRMLLERLNGAAGSTSKASATADQNVDIIKQQVAQHSLLDDRNYNEGTKNRRGNSRSKSRTRRNSRWNMALSRSKSMPMTLSSSTTAMKKGTRMSNSGSITETDRPAGGRQPLRLIRVRRRAATRIQTMARGFLTRISYRRKRCFRLEYMDFLEREKEKQLVLQMARESFQGDMKRLEEQKRAEIEGLRQQYLNAMKTWEEERLQSMVEEESEGMNVRLVEMQKEIKELRAERGVLIAEISLLGDMSAELERENAELVVTNEKMMSMFSGLNQFARASVAERQRLEGEAMIFNKVELAKLRQQMKGCSYATMAETAVKNVCRSSIYRYVHGLKDQGLVDAAMTTLFLCEQNLGNELIDEQEAMKLLEIDDLSSDDEDEVV